MTQGHTRNTVMPKKNLSYEQNWQKTLAIVEKLKQSPFVEQVIIFTECQLAQYWFSPVSQLEKKFNLSLKPQINKNLPLRDFILKTASKKFPLLTNNMGFTQADFLHLVKTQQINALICISGHCEPHILKDFKIFTTRDKNEVKYTNEITNKMVTVPFLSLLLNESKLKFILTDIHKIYIYPNCDFNPFKDKSEHLLQMIADYKSQKTIITFLKNISNFFIGSLCYNPNSHKNHQILSKTDFFSMDWTRFQGSFSVNEDLSICTFNKNQSFTNNIHNHFNIISFAKTIFLHFATGIAKWTKGELRICNTGKHLNQFLVADTRLYNPFFGPSVRRSVSRSVGRLVGWSVTNLFFKVFRCCPPIRD